MDKTTQIVERIVSRLAVAKGISPAEIEPALTSSMAEASLTFFKNLENTIVSARPVPPPPRIID